jgi:5-hydroxyisourate hydrolase
MSTVTTHVLDTSKGRPAVGMAVRLERGGEVLAEASTDGSGRVAELGPDDLAIGRYRLVFDTGPYFSATGDEAFHPQVTVDFEISDAGADYHVPLLLSPFGYTTYRGS